MYSFSLLGDPAIPPESEGLILLRFGGMNSEGREEDPGIDPSLPYSSLAFAAWTGREWCQKLRLSGLPADTEDSERSIADPGASSWGAG